MSNLNEVEKVLDGYVENTGGIPDKINESEYISERERALMNTIEKLTERIDRLKTVIVRSIGGLLKHDLYIDVEPIILDDGFRVGMVKIADYNKKFIIEKGDKE